MDEARPQSRRRRPLPAFYIPSDPDSSAAQIMSEARRSLRVPLTQRPCTPADARRMLFGKNRTSSRPPSVYSIGARNFSASRPTTAQRLEPLEPSNIIPPAQPSEVEADAVNPTPPTPVQSSSNLLPHSLSLTDHTPSQEPSEPLPRASAIENSDEGRRKGSGEGKRRGSVPLQSTAITRQPRSSSRETTKRLAGGGAKKKKKSEPRAPFWESEISPLLCRMSPGSQLDPTSLEETVGSLHRKLRERGCYGRAGGVAGSRGRSEVLRVVFSLLDSPAPSLLVKLANIIISMEVTGKNLLNVCKLLFSLARTETNDTLFLSEDISGPLLGLLRQCHVVSDSEALVYGVGTVKLLASNHDLRPQLVENEAFSFLLSLLFSYLQLENADGGQTANIENVLVQLTAALRNLLEHPPLASSLLSSGLLPHLATLLSSHISHPTITFNISRILSKLTLQRECCEAVISCPSFLPLLLHTLTLHHSHPEILVRVCFILGNLTTDEDSVRYELCLTHDALSPLSSLLSFSLTTELAKVEGEKESTKAHEKSPNEEILIKLLRLLANLSVEARVGAVVASHKEIVEALLTILDSLPLAEYSEVAVNSLATLNNLSFHSPRGCYLLHHILRLSQLLVRVLLEDNGEPLLECVRCYGNLSRHEAVCDAIAKSKVDELLITLLDSSRYELVFASCGVLVNLMTHSHPRATLSSSSGINKLLDVLRDFGRGDWHLAGLVCQILWNFSAEGMTSSIAIFGQDEVERLINLLQSYTEEVPERGEEEWREHFIPVGTTLLDRVFSNHTPLLPLPSTSS